MSRNKSKTNSNNNCSKSMFVNKEALGLWSTSSASSSSSSSSSVILPIKFEILHKGYLTCKTNLNEKTKNYYMVLRQITDKNNKKKLYIEANKDESLSKIKFIIDMDHVEQINLKDKENLISLKRDESNEFCLLGSGDKSYLKEWLNILCINCGFSEIFKIKNNNKISKTPTLTNSQHSNKISNNKQSSSLLNTNHTTNKLRNQLKTLRDLINSNKNPTTYNNVVIIQETHQDIKKSSAGNVNNSMKNLNLKNTNPKTIAGQAALSVGSFDLCNNPMFNILFKKHSNSKHYDKENQMEKLGYLDLENLPKTSNGKERDSYLCLQECLSGNEVENDFNMNQSKKFKNQIPQINVDQFNITSNIIHESKSLNDLNCSMESNFKLTYVPLQVLTYQDQDNQDTLNSNSQLSFSSYFNNIQKLYDLEVKNSFNPVNNDILQVKSNNHNQFVESTKYPQNESFSYTYLDEQRTQALKKVNKNF